MLFMNEIHIKTSQHHNNYNDDILFKLLYEQHNNIIY